MRADCAWGELNTASCTAAAASGVCDCAAAQQCLAYVVSRSPTPSELRSALGTAGRVMSCSGPSPLPSLVRVCMALVRRAVCALVAVVSDDECAGWLDAMGTLWTACDAAPARKLALLDALCAHAWADAAAARAILRWRCPVLQPRHIEQLLGQQQYGDASACALAATQTSDASILSRCALAHPDRPDVLLAALKHSVPLESFETFGWNARQSLAWLQDSEGYIVNQQ